MAINRHLHPRSLKQGPEISPYFLWGGGVSLMQSGPQTNIIITLYRFHLIFSGSFAPPTLNRRAMKKTLVGWVI